MSWVACCTCGYRGIRPSLKTQNVERQSHYRATTQPPHTLTQPITQPLRDLYFHSALKSSTEMQRQIQQVTTRGLRKCTASCNSSQRDGSENAPRVSKVPNEMPPKMLREFEKVAARCLRKCAASFKSSQRDASKKCLARFSGEAREGRVGYCRPLPRRPDPPQKKLTPGNPLRLPQHELSFSDSTRRYPLWGRRIKQDIINCCCYYIKKGY